MAATTRVDLWLSAEVETTPALLDAYRTWLSEDEALRWQRFHRAEDRNRYLLTRGLVRGVLANYTGQSPSTLAFDLQHYGKPVLGNAASPPHFNLSHTRGLVVLAVSRETEVGVDIEAIDLKLDPLQLAERHFSSIEKAQLAASAEPQRRERFFELWTLKEAYLKALGQGLSRDLTSFSVNLGSTPPTILDHDLEKSMPDPSQQAACQCRLYTPQAGYRLALAARNATANLHVTLARGLPIHGFGPRHVMTQQFLHRSGR